MKTKAVILSVFPALVALLTISVLSTDATSRPETAVGTTDAPDECPMHQQTAFSSEDMAGSSNRKEILALIEACENEVDLVLSSGDLAEMTEKLNQFRQRLTHTKQGLLQPASSGGCCGDTKPAMMPSRDAAVGAHSGYGAENAATSSTE